MRKEFNDGGEMMPRPRGVPETALYVDNLVRPGRFYQTIFGFELIDFSNQLSAMSVVGCLVLLFGKRGKEDNF